MNSTFIFISAPPNSGKTHDSLNTLIEAGSGWYLAPLRLLAYEIYDRLNAQGVLCNLVTGEERIEVQGASITAATIEMFNPNHSGRCIIIDEAQMLANADRGWAWTRALMEAKTPEIHVISSSTACRLIEKLAEAAAISLSVIEHERLTPIEVAPRAWSLNKLPPQTILVAFSRRMVLQLKQELQDKGRKVSVVYGALPPEVRRRQADRFANRETEICVATDAVGMGLNLPADNVCFYEITKYDGRDTRYLKPSEVQQIGGRAGRFGLSQAGLVSVIEREDYSRLRQLFYAKQEILEFARVAPTLEDIKLLPGSLHERLKKWAMLDSIPEHLKGIIKTADLNEPIELSGMLRDREVEELGLSAAMKIINAPTRLESRPYWRECVTAILSRATMPLPPRPPKQIRDDVDLQGTEASIGCADIYLWLSQRREFQFSGPDAKTVREVRRDWAANIDHALLRQIKAVRQCSRCGKRLPSSHPYGICTECYRKRRRYHYYYD